MRPIPISVVIPTYNRYKTLYKTLCSLIAGKVIPQEIIVVDQSMETSDRMVPQSEQCQIRVVSEKVPSLTRSRNIGMKLASNDVVLFCDDDILIDENSLERLWQKISCADTVLVAAIHVNENACFVPQKRNPIKDIIGTFFGTKKFWHNDGYLIKGSMRGRYSSQIKYTVSTEWAMGYFFCIKKTYCLKWNIFFDEKLKKYAYAEDLDFSYRYCTRAKKEGLKTLLEPSIYVNHLASKEWRLPSDELTFHYFANRWYLSYKMFPSQKCYRVALCWFDWLFECSEKRNEEYRKQIHSARTLCRAKRKMLAEGKIECIIDTK